MLNSRFDIALILDHRAHQDREHPVAAALARHMPVLIVQPDLPTQEYRLAPCGIKGAMILHVYATFGREQTRLINLALRQQRCIRPLLWVCDERFCDAVIDLLCPLKVFCPTAGALELSDERRQRLSDVLAHTDLLVAASPEVLSLCREGGRYNGAHIMAGVGTDWARLIESLASVTRKSAPEGTRYNVLILYDASSIHIGTVAEYLQSFAAYSRNAIYYSNATWHTRCPMDLAYFDIIIIHYSVRQCIHGHLSPEFAKRLRAFGGLKVLFIQDEYDHTNNTCDQIEDLGLHVVFTCVPPAYQDAVYPRKRFPHVQFVENLTGYVPNRLEHLPRSKPPAQRRWVIGYRGRRLPFWYGKLGQEKYLIGLHMREICRAKGVAADIEWEDDKRIYGPAWYEFLGDSRATLGTESGANVFDFDGSLHARVKSALMRKPDMTFDEVFERFLKDSEGRIVMNQVSPKIFEAIAMGTALVLFEGEYSGVVKKDVHYIPLKKDYSNADEVLAKLEDIPLLERMTQQAYRDVVESGAYSYKTFIEMVDAVLAAAAGPGKGVRLISSVVAFERSARADFVDESIDAVRLFPQDDLLPLTPTQINQLSQGPPSLGGKLKQLVPGPVRRLRRKVLDTLSGLTVGKVLLKLSRLPMRVVRKVMKIAAKAAPAAAPRAALAVAEPAAPDAPAALPTKGRVLFVGSAYYNTLYLSRALRRLGWTADTLVCHGEGAQGFMHSCDFMLKEYEHWDRQYDQATFERLSAALPEYLKRAPAKGDPAAGTLLKETLRHYLQSMRREFPAELKPLWDVLDHYDVLHFSGINSLRYFHFFNPHLFSGMPIGWDIELLRRLGKKIVFTITGCMDGVSQTAFRAWGGDPVCDICRWHDEPTVCSDKSNMAWGHLRNSVSDYIVNLGGNNADYNDDPRVHEVPEFFCLDPDVWSPDLEIPPQYRRPASDTVKIYHAVGNYHLRTRTKQPDWRRNINIKCTHIIAPAIEQLKAEGLDVEMVFCHDVPNIEVRYYQAQADIFVDMLTYGWFGANVREALMLGKPAVCYLRPEWLRRMRQEIPEYVDELPVISATPATIHDVLRDLVRNPDKRREIGRRGRQFALKWHSAQAGGNRLDRIYSQLLAERGPGETALP
ncbi:MAG: glycosyltransferase [Planctomycetaceae bacterium]|nr:glycosyltransferase [Planctomycetaceae bacterium]